MKKIILPCIISFIIMTISNYSLAATAKVNATAVRIRESASTNSNILKNLYKEDEVEILEESGEWYKVKYGETVGYAKAEFFTKSATDTAQTTNTATSNTTETQNTEVTNETENTSVEQPVVNSEDKEQVDQNIVSNELNTDSTIQEFQVGENITIPTTVKLRVIPSLLASTKTEIAQGMNITIEAKMGNWYKITDQTATGWVTRTKLSAEVTVTEPLPEKEQEPVQTESEVSVAPENTTTAENVVPEQTTQQTQESQTSEETTAVNKTAIVIVETARVRKSASKNADIIEVLDEDDVVTITGEEGEFYKITSEKISSGYISKSLVKVKDVTSRSSTEEREDVVSTEANEALNQSLSQGTASSVTGSDVIEFAKQYLGYSYVLGCSSPESGFDCSGFTRYVFGHFGYTLGQVAASQTSLGNVVEREDLQTGDLILFYNDGKTKIGHCGIFIGGGDFIHSANPQRGVVIDNLNTNSYYNSRFVTARRIVEK